MKEVSRQFVNEDFFYLKPVIHLTIQAFCFCMSVGSAPCDEHFLDIITYVWHIIILCYTSIHITILTNTVSFGYESIPLETQGKTQSSTWLFKPELAKISSRMFWYQKILKEACKPTKKGLTEIKGEEDFYLAFVGKVHTSVCWQSSHLKWPSVKLLRKSKCNWPCWGKRAWLFEQSPTHLCVKTL